MKDLNQLFFIKKKMTVGDNLKYVFGNRYDKLDRNTKVQLTVMSASPITCCLLIKHLCS